MKTRLLGAYLGVCLCLASLYMMGAGANYPYVWLFLAALLGIASAINFGVFDSRAVGLMRLMRYISYVAILGCVTAIILNRGTSEPISLTLAGFAAALMFISALTEPRFGDRGKI